MARKDDTRTNRDELEEKLQARVGKTSKRSEKPTAVERRKEKQICLDTDESSPDEARLDDLLKYIDSNIFQ